MASEVRLQVDAGQAYPVVRVTGVLDTVTAPTVRFCLLDLLAGQPEAVVVDVRQLTVGEPAAVAVLAGIARDAADWPGCHLLLGAGADAAAWRDTGLPVWPTPEEAVAALGAPEPRRFLRAPLEPVVGAARRSRELVTEACGRWDLPELAGPACIVVTEMVNNVVAHAHTPMTVLLALRGESMSVAVRDQSPHVPRFTGSPVPVTSYGGRGLLLIDSVAQRWGSLVLEDGKVVWAVLDAGESATQLPSTGLAGRAHG
ncbi:ATP-binding protein [Actinoplanes auranticolor]|uniref:Sulfate transporter n=1 Tax=Actinoplanes auranticolor TaxID=47988 RepID=A0A919VQK8_9ACTN|nr:ATP-binding protein [Actinoplanes auranticolor]GIM72671.1 sulfate transporter [Actinoplanes auranticolor]